MKYKIPSNGRGLGLEFIMFFLNGYFVILTASKTIMPNVGKNPVLRFYSFCFFAEQRGLFSLILQIELQPKD
ncbi:MAG: hypothetical protein M1495_25230 [Bacteroidetes bacterium]|nr:hypothetical protein [Bacteroidota bacterium]MCL6099114.1 hypothetical protein [Bacteroidota bacterium]